MICQGFQTLEKNKSHLVFLFFCLETLMKCLHPFLKWHINNFFPPLESKIISHRVLTLDFVNLAILQPLLSTNYLKYFYLL